MKHVYVLQSLGTPGRFYTGITDAPDARLEEHNSGKSPHTAKYRPWQMKVVVSVASDEQARRFEIYLKSGSGRAFVKKHFG